MAKKVIGIWETSFKIKDEGEEKQINGATIAVVDTTNGQNRLSSYFVGEKKYKEIGLTKEMMPTPIEKLPDVNIYFDEGFKGKVKIAKIELV